MSRSTWTHAQKSIPRYFIDSEFLKWRVNNNDFGTVLELGSGESERYIPYSITLDLNKTYSPDILGDGRCLPFKSDSINTMIGIEILEHIDRLDQFLTECHRVLKNGGVFYFSTRFIHPVHGKNDYHRITAHITDKLFMKFRTVVYAKHGGFFACILNLVLSGRNVPVFLTRIIEWVDFNHSNIYMGCSIYGSK